METEFFLCVKKLSSYNEILQWLGDCIYEEWWLMIADGNKQGLYCKPSEKSEQVQQPQHNNSTIIKSKFQENFANGEEG